MKKIFLILSISIFVNSFIFAQESKFKIVSSNGIDLGNKAVKDFKMQDNSYIFLLNDTIISMDKQNNKKIKSVTNVEGLDIVNSKVVTINSNSVNTYTKDGSTPIVLKAMYLASTSDGYFTCKFAGNDKTASFNNQIVFINKNGIETFVCYIGETPTGLFVKNDNLYYLTSNNSTSFIKTYNIKSNKCTEISEIPVKKATGLTIDNDGYFITFSNITNQIIKMRRE